MPDDEGLTPANPRDLVACLAYALTHDSRLAKIQAADVMATIVAERIVARLTEANFVVMQRPPAPGARAVGRGFEGG